MELVARRRAFPAALHRDHQRRRHDHRPLARRHQLLDIVGDLRGGPSARSATADKALAR
jgi:hypothetical protein